MLWAIGTGNYQASDIYEEGNKKLKSLGASTSILKKNNNSYKVE
jgi:hypothetical protein